MIIPSCTLLVLNFTSIWAILEPQSSTRLGNKEQLCNNTGGAIEIKERHEKVNGGR